MLYFIYALVDPREEGSCAVGYVGCTHRSPNDRLREHLADGQQSQKKKVAWIQSLLAEAVTPDIEVLEVVKGDKLQADEREKYWIQYYVSQGASLAQSRHVETVQQNALLSLKEVQLEQEQEGWVTGQELLMKIESDPFMQELVEKMQRMEFTSGAILGGEPD